MPEFIKFPKTKRLESPLQITVTEKIDGTNGLIYIENYEIYAGSRNRFITPDDDNYEFAQWVEDNKPDLMSLGDGYHYGEWYGRKINRGYDIDYRGFALFNVDKWAYNPNMPKCCHTVQCLYDGDYKGLEHLMDIWESLVSGGSVTVSGYMRPEGMMVFFKDFNKYMKMPLSK